MTNNRRDAVSHADARAVRGRLQSSLFFFSENCLEILYSTSRYLVGTPPFLLYGLYNVMQAGMYVVGTRVLII